MFRLLRTDSTHTDFIELVKKLDSELAERDGEDTAFYSQYNKINEIKYAIIAYDKEKSVGCGAIKEYDTGAMEVKRMYVLPAYRGKGGATQILLELEKWAAELGYAKCVLETGKRQPEAIRLYLKNNYNIIPNYGQYQGIENSVCFEKEVHLV